MRRVFVLTLLPTLILFLLPFSVSRAEPAHDRALRKFSASDICSFRYSGFLPCASAEGPYIYINKMQYKLHANPTGGKSQFRLRVPDAIIIPPRYTSDINWWGDKRRDNWWNQKKWTTFWKRSYMKGKVSVRGADWTGKFRADLSGQGDKECSFRLKV